MLVCSFKLYQQFEGSVNHIKHRKGNISTLYVKIKTNKILNKLSKNINA